ncbi:MAG: outer membrane lipoprotein carrier protein LolA [Robiginitomaculum sp.]|nr:outer membrane lipoprotein carrier protein LolA [Robiginitomaculum sp.]
MKTKFISLAIAAIFVLPAFSAAETVPVNSVDDGVPAQEFFTAEPVPMDVQAEVKRLNKFVRSIRTIKGGFVQTAVNGSMETGNFYWRRPGKLRIEYKNSPLLIVADGTNIAQIDKELETIDQIRISWTPYKFLLSRRFDLSKGVELVGIEKLPEQTRVTIRDLDGEMDGEFTLVFAEPNLALIGWTWENAYDGQVDFILTDTVEGEKLASSLFVIREQDRRRGGRRR